MKTSVIRPSESESELICGMQVNVKFTFLSFMRGSDYGDQEYLKCSCWSHRNCVANTCCGKAYSSIQISFPDEEFIIYNPPIWTLSFLCPNF